MYSKPQTEQFRAFFAAKSVPVSIDRISGREQQRHTQSTYSYSQSQERSQATTSQHVGSSGPESQFSSPRYDELLAGGRHLEIKDSLAALNKAVLSLSQGVGSIQSSMSEHLHKLNIIQVTIQELREAQSKQECSIAEILKLVDQVRTERTSHSRSSPIDSFGVSETEDCREPVSPLSEGGMSVTEYLNVRKLQIKASALIGEGRKRARSVASSQETTDSEPSGHEARVKLLASRTQQQARVLNPGASPLRSTPVLKAAAPEQPRSVRQAVSEDSAAAMLFEDF